MRTIFTTLAFFTFVASASAQPIICSGNPLTGINGTTYDSVAGTGPGMHGVVAGSKDGKLYSNNGGKLRYINTNSFAVMDSMDIDWNYMVGLQSDDTLFGLKANTLCRLNATTKTFIDSLPIAGLYRSKITERPNAKEIWAGGAPLSIIDYANALTLGPSFTLGTNIINIKFSTDGLVAYANSGVTKRIYVIDAVNKVVTDSIDFAPESPASMEVSADNSKLFVTVTGKVRVLETTNYTAIDSTPINMPITSLYRHPTKPEIWCVHHFRDSVSVFNMNAPYNLMDSIPVGGSPFFLAFGEYSTGVTEITTSSDITLYPNPAKDMVTIEMSISRGELELYDSRGALLKKQQITSKKQVLHIGGLLAGHYFISATDATGRRSIARFNKI